MIPAQQFHLTLDRGRIVLDWGYRERANHSKFVRLLKLVEPGEGIFERTSGDEANTGLAIGGDSIAGGVSFFEELVIDLVPGGELQLVR